MINLSWYKPTQIVYSLRDLTTRSILRLLKFCAKNITSLSDINIIVLFLFKLFKHYFFAMWLRQFWIDARLWKQIWHIIVFWQIIRFFWKLQDQNLCYRRILFSSFCVLYQFTNSDSIVTLVSSRMLHSIWFI